jgi:hypothetical protein
MLLRLHLMTCFTPFNPIGSCRFCYFRVNQFFFDLQFIHIIQTGQYNKTWLSNCTYPDEYSVELLAALASCFGCLRAVTTAPAHPPYWAFRFSLNCLVNSASTILTPCALASLMIPLKATFRKAFGTGTSNLQASSSKRTSGSILFAA